MKPAELRLACAAGVLLLFLTGVAGLALTGSGKVSAPVGGASLAKEPRLLTEQQSQTFWFFARGNTGAGAGPGLFETDFFKPAQAPKPAPKPVPPATRNLTLTYRGLAVFPDGSRIAYLATEGRTSNPVVGDTIADGWKLASFDSEQAVLAKDEARLILPFNRGTVLTVPVKP